MNLRGPNENNFLAILEHAPPHDVKSSQRYLGMIVDYRTSIPYCAEIKTNSEPIAPHENREVLGETQQSEFACPSRAVTENVCLIQPDMNRLFVPQTDVSDYGLGAFLSQEHDSYLFPVAFASHKFTGAERNYSTTEKKYRVIIFALNTSDMYLDGDSLYIESDQ